MLTSIIKCTAVPHALTRAAGLAQESSVTTVVGPRSGCA